MEFKDFNTVLQKHVTKMCKDKKYLFVVELDKADLWDKYLESFPPRTNEVFKERREHDCNCCRHFIKAFGNVVTIRNNKVTTIWDFKVLDETYQTVIMDYLSNCKKNPHVL